MVAVVTDRGNPQGIASGLGTNSKIREGDQSTKGRGGVTANKDWCGAAGRNCLKSYRGGSGSNHRVAVGILNSQNRSCSKGPSRGNIRWVGTEGNSCRVGGGHDKAV